MLNNMEDLLHSAFKKFSVYFISEMGCELTGASEGQQGDKSKHPQSAQNVLCVCVDRCALHGQQKPSDMRNQGARDSRGKGQ